MGSGKGQTKRVNNFSSNKMMAHNGNFITTIWNDLDEDDKKFQISLGPSNKSKFYLTGEIWRYNKDSDWTETNFVIHIGNKTIEIEGAQLLKTANEMLELEEVTDTAIYSVENSDNFIYWEDMPGDKDKAQLIFAEDDYQSYNDQITITSIKKSDLMDFNKSISTLFNVANGETPTINKKANNANMKKAVSKEVNF